MESRPLNYRSGAQYAAYQTDPTSLSSPYTSLYEWQAPAWPLYPSTASAASHPPFPPLASSSADTSSATSLAATFGGYQYPYYASNFPNNDLFASTVLHQPRQTPHIVEAPLATVAPQLTWGSAPTYTPTYSPPVLPQQNRNPPSRPTKRRREEAEDPEKGQVLKATSGKKRRAVGANSRSHNPLADIRMSFHRSLLCGLHSTDASGPSGTAVLSACSVSAVGRSRSANAPVGRA